MNGQTVLLGDGDESIEAVELGTPGLAGAEQGVKNAEKLNAVNGVQVYIMTHAWQDPNVYPGGGIHERAKKLANRKPGDPHPAVPPQRRHWRSTLAAEHPPATGRELRHRRRKVRPGQDCTAARHCASKSRQRGKCSGNAWTGM
jgi:hypothetical protein